MIDGIREWTIEAKGVKSLCWIGDELVDWVDGGHVYQLDGIKRERWVGYWYRFDAAVVSPSGQFAVIYEKLGTKGLVLDNGKIIREINRSFYFAHAFEYPVTLLKLPDGREVIAHCPESYSQIEIDELDTGKRITDSVGRNERGSIFYSRLEANNNGSLLLSAGWVWQPRDIVTLHEIERALTDPTALNGRGTASEIPDGVNSAAFLGENLLVLATDEEPNEDEETDPKAMHLLSSSVGLYNISEGRFILNVPVKERVGKMLPINTNFALGFYEHPKLVSLQTGEVLYRWSDINSGQQTSSILWTTPPVPPLTLDPKKSRFAVADTKSIHVVQIDIDKLSQAI